MFSALRDKTSAGRDGESPMLGLFYVECEFHRGLRMNAAEGRPSATGMAWLASADGIVATCAHVVLALDARPGDRIVLFGAAPSIDIAVDAEVLCDGWAGPLIDAQGQRLPHPLFEQFFDDRPDVFREDIALLRLLPDTAVWHCRVEQGRHDALRGDDSPGARLLRNARFLPLSCAGYRTPGASLVAWRVNWINQAPDCQQAEAEFRSYDEESFHGARVRSRVLSKGFSGGPLWDPNRRVVVGMLRRMLPAMGDLVLATDGRGFAAVRPQLRLAGDLRLQALRRHVAARLDNAQPARYMALGGANGDALYVEPQIMPVLGSIDPLQALLEDEPLPAVDYLAEQWPALRRVVVRGAAGIGKSSLLRRLAKTLLGRAETHAGPNVIPVLLDAAEFVAGGCDVAACLEQLWRAARPPTFDADSAMDVLFDNGASIVMMIDGLDEVPEVDRAKVLARLDIRRALTSQRGWARTETDDVDRLLAGVVVSTRPNESWLASGSSQGFGVEGGLFDLLRFDATRIERFCALAVEDPARRAAFIAALNQRRWGKEEVTPLQLRMAVAIFLHDQELPPRSIDLSASFVALDVAQACREYQAHHRGPLPDEVRDFYLPSLTWILGFVAVTKDGWGSAVSEEEVLEACRAVAPNDARHPWLRNIGALIRFICRDIPPYLRILIAHPESGRIEWAHRTFAELVGAEYLWATQHDPATLRERAFAMMEQGHAPALAFLGVMDRANADGLVEGLLRRCMDSMSGRVRPQLFALRALGAGIDAKGRARRALVELLVRHLVSDFREAGLCRHFFLHENLPDAAELLAYEELRSDLFEVMQRRFHVRLRRATPTRPAVVMSRESKILRLTGLWPDFIDLGLRRPLSDEGDAEQRLASMPDRSMAPPAHGNGVARVLVRTSDGGDRLVTLPALEFVNAVAAVARGTDQALPAAELVELVINLGAQDGDRAR